MTTVGFLFQKLIFKPRSKSNKTCNNESAKNKKKKPKKEMSEEDATIPDREKVIKGENERARAGESEEDVRAEEATGEAETGGEEDAAEHVPEKEGEEEVVPDCEASPEQTQLSGTAEEAEISVAVEAQSETKEKEVQRGAEDDGVIENGLEVDEEGCEDEDYLVECTPGQPADVGVFSKEVTVESSGQNPEETV